MLSSIVSFSLLAASLVSSQNVIDNLSFGHKQGSNISPNAYNIPGWSMLGSDYQPEVLSDKVILTPPFGGGKRGALWSKEKSQKEDWIATLDFRASGVDNGKGNLQFWYAKDGENTVGTGSIYTAGKFDGLAVVIDTNEGIQKIRGFLSDGTIDYHQHANVDSLAFGHCTYNYRNLGRPSKLEVKATSSALEVTIDGTQCFMTSKVALPTDYNFGMTAASTEPPDSFELFKLEVRTPSTDSTDSTAKEAITLNHPQSTKDSPVVGGNLRIITSQAQFEDLHNRLNQVSKSISNMFTEINTHTKAEEQRYQEILRQLPSSSAISSLESRLSNVDRLLSELTKELKGGNHKEQFERISQQLQESHQSLTQHLPGKMRDYVQNHTPRIGFIVFSFMAFQSCCLGVLLWQKWRKSTMPKKYL